MNDYIKSLMTSLMNFSKKEKLTANDLAAIREIRSLIESLVRMSIIENIYRLDIIDRQFDLKRVNHD